MIRGSAVPNAVSVMPEKSFRALHSRRAWLNAMPYDMQKPQCFVKRGAAQSAKHGQGWSQVVTALPMVHGKEMENGEDGIFMLAAECFNKKCYSELQPNYEEVGPPCLRQSPHLPTWSPTSVSAEQSNMSHHHAGQFTWSSPMKWPCRSWTEYRSVNKVGALHLRHVGQEIMCHLRAAAVGWHAGWVAPAIPYYNATQHTVERGGVFDNKPADDVIGGSPMPLAAPRPVFPDWPGGDAFSEHIYVPREWVGSAIRVHEVENSVEYKAHGITDTESLDNFLRKHASHMSPSRRGVLREQIRVHRAARDHKITTGVPHHAYVNKTKGGMFSEVAMKLKIEMPAGGCGWEFDMQAGVDPNACDESMHMHAHEERARSLAYLGGSLPQCNVVNSVKPGSNAHASGLQPGDRVLSMIALPPAGTHSDAAGMWYDTSSGGVTQLPRAGDRSGMFVRLACGREDFVHQREDIILAFSILSVHPGGVEFHIARLCMPNGHVAALGLCRFSMGQYGNYGDSKFMIDKYCTPYYDKNASSGSRFCKDPSDEFGAAASMGVLCTQFNAADLFVASGVDAGVALLADQSNLSDASQEHTDTTLFSRLLTIAHRAGVFCLRADQTKGTLPMVHGVAGIHTGKCACEDSACVHRTRPVKPESTASDMLNDMVEVGLITIDESITLTLQIQGSSHAVECAIGVPMTHVLDLILQIQRLGGDMFAQDPFSLVFYAGDENEGGRVKLSDRFMKSQVVHVLEDHWVWPTLHEITGHTAHAGDENDVNIDLTEERFRSKYAGGIMQIWGSPEGESQNNRSMVQRTSRFTMYGLGNDQGHENMGQQQVFLRYACSGPGVHSGFTTSCFFFIVADQSTMADRARMLEERTRSSFQGETSMQIDVMKHFVRMGRMTVVMFHSASQCACSQYAHTHERLPGGVRHVLENGELTWKIIMPGMDVEVLTSDPSPSITFSDCGHGGAETESNTNTRNWRRTDAGSAACRYFSIELTSGGALRLQTEKKYYEIPLMHMGDIDQFCLFFATSRAPRARSWFSAAQINTIHPEIAEIGGITFQGECDTLKRRTIRCIKGAGV